MKIEQIRNATLRLQYAGKNFLIDPWLTAKGATGFFNDLKAYHLADPVKASIKIPLCEFPESTDKILTDIDMYILTHLHPDHFDVDMASGKGGKLLDKTLPILVQNENESNFMLNSGFKNVTVLVDNFIAFDNIKIMEPSNHVDRLAA